MTKPRDTVIQAYIGIKGKEILDSHFADMFKTMQMENTTQAEPIHILQADASKVDPEKFYWIRFGGLTAPWGRTVRMGGAELLTKLEYLKDITNGTT